ncbi:hypothetical protein AB0J35_29045 [Nonomuraea angiospora]|uniref:hypothetical protein n=1 Tax=Nonomuraea angiospora TaxID=46172 RepID=UPI0034252053
MRRVKRVGPIRRRTQDNAPRSSPPPYGRSSHDTGFAPAFDIATAVADYVAWPTDNPR